MSSQDAQRGDGGHLPSPQDATVKPSPLPTTFVLELTQRCNNRCGYCYNAWRAPDLEYPRVAAKEMSIGQIEQALVSSLKDGSVDLSMKILNMYQQIVAETTLGRNDDWPSFQRPIS